MERYPIGNSVRVTVNFYDATNTLVNPTTSALALYRFNADGTNTTTNYSTGTSGGTGIVYWDLSLTDIATAAHYAWKSTLTSGSFQAVQSDVFDVFDPIEPKVLTLKDAKETLNIPTSVTTDDAEITATVATIVANLENFLGGPAVNRSVTERVDLHDDWYTIWVKQRKLVSVTSITDVSSGAALDVSNLDLSRQGIRNKSGAMFSTSLGIVTVVYVAGFGVTVPYTFNQFARTVLQHLWNQQRGPSAPRFGSPETVTLPGFGFAIPNAAAELLAPYVKPSFAR